MNQKDMERAPRGLDELLRELESAFADYRLDLERYEQKKNPLGGLFGVGASLKDDACHDRLDERLEAAVGELCELLPPPQEAARAVRTLLSPGDGAEWPLAAEWMLRAVERHALPLIPFLTPQAAEGFWREYAARYKPWDRLPRQKEVYRALKERAAAR